MTISYGDRYEREKDGEVYVAGFIMQASEYDPETEEAEWSEVRVRLCREWDDYGPMPTFWTEDIEEFLESVED